MGYLYGVRYRPMRHFLTTSRIRVIRGLLSFSGGDTNSGHRGVNRQLQEFHVAVA